VHKLRAVFFDLYNTICYFEPSREERQQRAAGELGFAVSVCALQRAYAKAEEYWTIENALQPIALRPEAERRAFYTEYERHLLALAGLEVTAGQAGEMYQHYSSYPRALRLFDDTLPMMTHLRSRGIKTGLISNNDRPVEPICDDLLLTPHLDAALSSFVFGCEKPDPRIFVEAQRLLGVDPAGSIHIGDQYHSDGLGALAAGIQPILIDRYGLLPRRDDCLYITNLWQLPNVLCASR
jgi:HAD superfamily hydrolase (TIGR01549 family)